MTSTIALPMHSTSRRVSGTLFSGNLWKGAPLAAQSSKSQHCLGKRERASSDHAPPGHRSALLLSACLARPAVEPQVAQPVPATRPGAGQLIGFTTSDLVAHFGSPALQVREGTSLKLQFRGQLCVLDAYLYPRAEQHAAGHLCRYADKDRRRYRSGGLHLRARKSELSKRPLQPLRRLPDRDRRDAFSD